MTKEIFIDEWIWRPKTAGRTNKEIHIKCKIPLDAYQLYVVKLYKLVISKKEDYNELMKVMKNLRLNDKKKILSYINKFLPGEQKIRNVQE